MQTATTVGQEHARVLALRQELLRVGTGGSRNTALTIAVTACAVAILVIVVAIAVTMVSQAWPSLRQFGFAFIATQTWDPVAGRFGALPFIFGTVVSSAIA